MSLFDRAEKLPLETHLTLNEVVEKTGADYQAVWKWLVRNDKIPLYCVGDVLLVRKEDLQKYNHR